MMLLAAEDAHAAGAMKRARAGMAAPTRAWDTRKRRLVGAQQQEVLQTIDLNVVLQQAVAASKPVEQRPPAGMLCAETAPARTGGQWQPAQEQQRHQSLQHPPHQLQQSQDLGQRPGAPGASWVARPLNRRILQLQSEECRPEAHVARERWPAPREVRLRSAVASTHAAMHLL